MMILAIIFAVILYCTIGAIIGRILKRVDVIVDNEGVVVTMVLWPIMLLLFLITAVPWIVGVALGDIIVDKFEAIVDKLNNKNN